MKQKHILGYFFLFTVLLSTLTACDTAFQNNPHGPAYLNQLNQQETAPSIPVTKQTPLAHFSPFGLGTSLQSLVAQYGQPTKYTVPPLYIFQDGNESWPNGSLIVVTMKDGRAIEFSYVPGTDHPMTYQEAQDFAVKLLPDDAQGPKTVQLEDDHNGKCLAKVYHSELLAKFFPAEDFISPDGKDSDLGSVTINFFPDANTSGGTYAPAEDFGSNILQNTNQVNSVFVD